jgi:hypothetical protein
MPKDLDDYRAAAKKRQERTKTEKFGLKVGDNTIRILKTPKGRTSPAVFFEFAMHNKVGPEKKWLRCGIDIATGKGKCYICQKEIPRLEKRGKEERASALAPEPKMVLQVASIDDGEKWTGPHLFWPSSGKAGEITTLLLSTRKDYVDPRRGYNFGISRTGTDLKTRYGPIEIDADPSKVPSKIMDKLKSFDDLASIPKYDEAKQKAALEGREVRDDDEDDSRSRKRGRDEDEDEDDYDEDVEDAEDEDEDDEDTPRSKKKKKSKIKVSKKRSRDEQLDDEDEDDEEDEPVRKKKKKSSR